ncbi:ArnT family glycosyltransferase [Haladaptatus sp. GCM10025707]|uniref:ArnT family glycosyltransferase n=1 Tax=unclassified Haladaptatus TaxID=2622732 RepID=UPI0023E75771|nr:MULTISPECIES: glycosyltransferase family 39 protein [unclassified Haladaptatus]
MTEDTPASPSSTPPAGDSTRADERDTDPNSDFSDLKRAVLTSLAFALLGALVGVVIYVVATDLFPYHSSNHDEGVYLQQAALLLSGELWFATPLPDAFRPWFFVQDGFRLYPKYSPVPAAMFAIGMVLGEPRISLALIASGSALLVGALATEAFDERTGLLAMVVLLVSPLFLISSSVFLPYAPTFFLNLLFALGYVRAIRRRSYSYAALAGIAIGLAFFARPFTAVLFAIPFIVHALATVAVSLPAGEPLLTVTFRNGVIALLGGTGVALALAYNAAVTGSPFLFPFEAFAPLDGIGFGRRALLGYERMYTPTLALEANAHVIWEFATRWMPAGILGTALAALGIGATVGRDDIAVNPWSLSDGTLRWMLASLFVSISAGNVFFWGNANILARLETPADGLIAQFGPFYHFDLLLPIAVFGAAGILFLTDLARETTYARFDTSVARAILLVALVVSVPVVVSAEQSVLADPVAENRQYTERFEAAYEPFENQEFDNALVFMATPYGDWLNLPFQAVRNDAHLGGEAVYAIDRAPGDDFAVIQRYPDRNLYRYTFRGEWTPTPAPVKPAIQPLDVRNGSSHTVHTDVGVVSGAQSATVRIETSDGAMQYAYTGDLNESVALNWTITPQNASVVGENLRKLGSSSNETVALNGSDEAVMSVTFLQPGGSTVTYRQAVSVDAHPETNTVRVIWPPEKRVCRLRANCGYEGTYLKNATDYVSGVSFETNVTSQPAD